MSMILFLNVSKSITFPLSSTHNVNDWNVPNLEIHLQYNILPVFFRIKYFLTVFGFTWLPVHRGQMQ